jgi:hypothetical protein
MKNYIWDKKFIKYYNVDDMHRKIIWLAWVLLISFKKKLSVFSTNLIFQHWVKWELNFSIYVFLKLYLRVLHVNSG